MNSNKIIEKSNVFKNFKNDIINNKLNQAIILAGIDDATTEMFADFFALTILCKNQEPCLVCTSCVKTLAHTNIDLTEYPKSDKSISSSEVSELTDDVYVRPVEGDKKVYIIKKFDDASTICQNKLLKTLEEPPKNVYIILCVKNTTKILQTVISRCKIYNIDSFESNVIEEELIKYGSSKLQAEILSVTSNNSIGQALINKNDKNYAQILEFVYDMFVNVNKKNLIEYVSKTISYKKDINLFFSICEFVLNEIILCKTYNVNSVKLKAKSKLILQINDEFSYEAIANISRCITSAKERINSNCSISAVVDIFMLKFLEEKHKWK